VRISVNAADLKVTRHRVRIRRDATAHEESQLPAAGMHAEERDEINIRTYVCDIA
jgi:hypothetical protein